MDAQRGIIRKCPERHWEGVRRGIIAKGRQFQEWYEFALEREAISRGPFEMERDKDSERSLYSMCPERSLYTWH
jgi:hypothetical protein